MSLLQTFIDLEQKIETALKEVRVGFPEGLKQQLLAWGYDVGVWMSAHYMEVIASLAVALLLVIGLFSFILWTQHKSEVRLINQLKHMTLDCVFYKRARQIWYKAHSEAVLELDEMTEHRNVLLSEIEALERRVDELDNSETDLKIKVEELESEISDQAVEISELEDRVDDLKCDRDHFVDKCDEKDEEISELEDEIEQLRELNTTYSELVEKLDAANDDTLAKAA